MVNDTNNNDAKIDKIKFEKVSRDSKEDSVNFPQNINRSTVPNYRKERFLRSAVCTRSRLNEACFFFFRHKGP